MMAKTDDLISQLAQTAGPVRPSLHPLKLFLGWLAGCALYVAMLLFLYGVRDDLGEKWASPLFSAEIGLLVAMIAACGASTTLLSFPDMYQKRWAPWLPLLPLLLFIGNLFLAWLADNPPAPMPPHGMECLICIALFSSLPAAAMITLLRRQASTHYRLAGLIALIGASSTGCLALRLSEKTDSIMHVIEWHYLPMVGFAMIGIWLGSRFLKW